MTSSIQATGQLPTVAELEARISDHEDRGSDSYWEAKNELRLAKALTYKGEDLADPDVAEYRRGFYDWIEMQFRGHDTYCTSWAAVADRVRAHLRFNVERILNTGAVTKPVHIEMLRLFVSIS